MDRNSFLDATATVAGDGRGVYLHLINLHPDQAMEINIQLQGNEVQPHGLAWQIAPAHFDAQNDFDMTNVSIQHFPLKGLGAQFGQSLPPHSVTVLKLELR